MTRAARYILIALSSLVLGCARNAHSQSVGVAHPGLGRASGTTAALPQGPGVCTECGPAPGYPSSGCPDGKHRGGRGPCVRFEDGTCRWVRAVCPEGGDASCPPEACGARPAVQRWQCPEGQGTGELSACVRGADGRCGWAYRPCQGAPVSPKPKPSPHAVPAPSQESHSCEGLTPKEAMKWRIRELCDPIGHYPPILFGLPDGTSVYKRGEHCFRGRRSERCFKKCLPGSARIDTPEGPRRIDELHEGSWVWSVDASGARFAATLIRVGSVQVGGQHELMRVLLSDGRSVQASWHHPTASGGVVGELRPGSTLDGSTVVEVRAVPYSGQHTYDILPSGPTAFYFADGVLLGSTLGARDDL
jgi:hypothetical protein